MSDNKINGSSSSSVLIVNTSLCSFSRSFSCSYHSCASLSPSALLAPLLPRPRPHHHLSPRLPSPCSCYSFFPPLLSLDLLCPYLPRPQHHPHHVPHSSSLHSHRLFPPHILPLRPLLANLEGCG